MHGVLAFRGNMVVAMFMASPRMVCRFVAREIMEPLPPTCVLVASAGLDVIRGAARLCRMALAVAIARVVGELESTST